MPDNKRSIPEVRERLRELAEEHGIPELDELANEMYRKSPVRRAANKSDPLTSTLAKEIRKYARANPDLHQRTIAEKFNVNPGRVSEAMNRLA